MPTLDWLGKSAVLNHHREVPFHLLRRDPALSVGDPESGNLLVQGDNLLGLKALLPYYAGKVKCIYIDPPYNTGNENWVYNFEPVLVSCSRCMMVSLLGCTFDEEAPEVLYPSSSVMHSSVPEELWKDYSKTRRLIKDQPTAFAVMLRRSLDHILRKTLGRSSKGLRSGIRELGESGAIPIRLAEMADRIVWLGNVSAHELTEEISPEEAETLDSLYQSIIEYVYVAPSKIEAFKRVLDRRKGG